MTKKNKKEVSSEEVKEEAPVEEEPTPVAEPKGKKIYTANGPMLRLPNGSIIKITDE